MKRWKSLFHLMRSNAQEVSQGVTDTYKNHAFEHIIVKWGDGDK